MKKLLLFTAFIVILSVSVSAQMYHHGMGLAIYATTDGSAATPMISYQARLNLVELSDDMSISVSALPGIFFNLEANSRTGGTAALALDLPITADLNLGAFSTYDFDSDFGGFVSAGGAYTLMAGDVGNISAFGPLIRAGIRANILETYRAGLWGGFMANLNNGPSIFQVGVMWHWGDY